MEEKNTAKAFNPDLWFALGYITALVVMFATEKIARWLSSEAIVYTIPPASENGATSETGETVTSLVKEGAESE
jgi:hypothetical protein